MAKFSLIQELSVMDSMHINEKFRTKQQTET